MGKIKKISAREILDSRGEPTLETTVWTEKGCGRAAVPVGASRGFYEAFELRDNDSRRFQGRGVLKAVATVEEKIGPQLLGMEVFNQEKIDQKMIEADGTKDKHQFGGNSILSVSLAVARAAAKEAKSPLWQYLGKIFGRKPEKKFPQPMFNLINGGVHGGGNLAFQEFLVIPQRETFPQSLQLGVEIYHQLKAFLRKQGLSVSLGDEGGFTPNLSSSLEAFDCLEKTMATSSYRLGKEAFLGADLAANTFFRGGKYILEGGKSYGRSEFLFYLEKISRHYHLFSLEDPLAENDWENWQKLNKIFAGRTLLIGDDLLVTNPKRLRKALKLSACSGILVKPNQIGTLSETFKVIRMAKEGRLKVVISHRSGETNDDFVADLAVGVGADFVKFGAPARGERVAKYNRLWKIFTEEFSF